MGLYATNLEQHVSKCLQVTVLNLARSMHSAATGLVTTTTEHNVSDRPDSTDTLNLDVLKQCAVRF